jgi:hypothetical protein
LKSRITVSSIRIYPFAAALGNDQLDDKPFDSHMIARATFNFQQIRGTSQVRIFFDCKPGILEAGFSMLLLSCRSGTGKT